MEHILYLIIGGLGVILSGLAAWTWNHTHGRIEGLHKRIDGKADKQELERLRSIVDELAEKALTQLAQDRDRAAELSRVVVKLETQVSRALSDIDEDKRARDRIDSVIIEKLDTLLDRRMDNIPTSRHRRKDES